MTHDFLWWIWHSTRNRVRRQAQRLRSTRYLVATLLAVVYFALVFSGWFIGDPQLRSERRIELAGTVGPLALALISAWWWLWGGYRRALLLTPAETNLLVPAPITRRALVRFKIMQAQVAVLISTLIFSAFTRGTPLGWPLRALSLWLLFATLHLHQIAASLVHAAAEEQGGRGLRRNRVAVALFSVAFVVLLVSLTRALVAARASGSVTGALATILDVLQEPLPRLVLAPFRLLLAPTIASTIGEWVPAVAIAIVLLVLHYLWVQRTDAAFEETAAAEGARIAEQIAAARAGGFMRLAFSREQRARRVGRAWLPLRPTGRPAYALFWKNVIYVQRLLRRGMFAAVGFSAAVVLGMSFALSESPERGLTAIATMLLTFAGLTTLIGPFIYRNDLRMDLPYIDQLRTYPLRGRDVVLAAVAAGALCVTATQLVLLVVALGIGVIGGMFGLPLALAVLVAVLLVGPLVNAVSVLVQNAIALLFPAWTRLGAQGGTGMEAIGQNMLTLIGTMVLLVLVMIPPALAGAIVAAPVAMQFGTVAVVPGIIAGLAVTAVEAGAFAHWLGGLYESLDPAEAELLR